MIFYNERIFKRCFNWPWRRWYKNILNIPLYFKLMHHLIKHGYDEYAHWETFNWFIDIMKDILTYYRKHHQGYPVGLNFNDMMQEELEAQYDSELEKMIALLNDMDELNPKYDSMRPVEVSKSMESAKDEFFVLFSKHFYSLWD